MNSNWLSSPQTLEVDVKSIENLEKIKNKDSKLIAFIDKKFDGLKSIYEKKEKKFGEKKYLNVTFVLENVQNSSDDLQQKITKLNVTLRRVSLSENISKFMEENKENLYKFFAWGKEFYEQDGEILILDSFFWHPKSDNHNSKISDNDYNLEDFEDSVEFSNDLSSYKLKDSKQSPVFVYEVYKVGNLTAIAKFVTIISAIIFAVIALLIYHHKLLWKLIKKIRKFFSTGISAKSLSNK